MLLFILFEEAGLAGNYLFDPFSIIFANSLLSVSFALLAFRCELFTPGTAGRQSGTFREDSVHCETGNILRAVKEHKYIQEFRRKSDHFKRTRLPRD